VSKTTSNNSKKARMKKVILMIAVWAGLLVPAVVQANIGESRQELVKDNVGHTKEMGKNVYGYIAGSYIVLQWVSPKTDRVEAIMYIKFGHVNFNEEEGANVIGQNIPPALANPSKWLFQMEGNPVVGVSIDGKYTLIKGAMDPNKPMGSASYVIGLTYSIKRAGADLDNYLNHFPAK
jgi:hypothetical protein